MRTVLRLLGFLRPFWKWVLLSMLLSAATVTAGVGLLGTSAYLIAYAALQPSIAVLEVAIVGVRFFGISRAAFRYLERLTSHSVNFRLLAGLRTWFYRAIEPLSPARLTRIQSGDLLQRAIGDIETLENFYVRVVAPPVTALLVTLGMGLFAGHYRPVLGVVLAGGLLAGALLAPAITYWIGRGPGRRLVAVRAQVNATMLESFQGLADLTAFDALDLAEQSMQAQSGELTAVQMQVASGSGAVAFLEQILTNGTMLAVVWVAVPLVTHGQIDGISLAVLALLTLSSFEVVTPLPQAAQLLEGSLQAARRLFDLADQAPAILEPAQPQSLDQRDVPVCLEHLTFRYETEPAATLQEIHLEIQPGKSIAIVGPSGAGKSSLVNVLLRFWEFQAGSYSLGGVSARAFNSQDVRACFSVLGQSAYLFNTSVRHNLQMGNVSAGDGQMVSALQRAGLRDWFEALPQGLETWVGEHGVHLSGGERQRLAIARLILQDKPYLILDEPTANLDARTELALTDELLDLFAAKGVIWITHRLLRLERMDEILVMDRGRIVERGDHAGLLAQGGLYSRLWNYERILE